MPAYPISRVLLAVRNEAFRETFESFGVLLEGLEFREIGGWEYSRLIPLGGKDRPTPPKPLFWLLARLDPQLKARVRKAREAVRDGKAEEVLRRWYQEWRPDLEGRLDRLLAADLPQMDDAGFDRHLGQVLDLIALSRVHFTLHVPITIALAGLVFTCRDLLGWADEETFELLNGLSVASTEPSMALGEMVSRARRNPVLMDLLADPEVEVEALEKADPAFGEALARYMRRYGHRALRYEAAEPTLAETPRLVLALVRAQAQRGHDPEEAAEALARRRREKEAQALKALEPRPAEERQRFKRALKLAQQAYPVREENEFYTVSVPLAVLRYAALELGRRLSQRGQIGLREDVFFLEFQEAREGLRSGRDLSPLVEHRRRERAWVLSHPGPAFYGQEPGPPPPVDALPAEARFVMEAVLWAVNRVFAHEETAERARQDTSADRLSGTPASPGRYTGTVRVVMNEEEFHKVRPGDVLVCPITSPVWSVLFSSIGALVTDTGGILSHPAIIAREYRIPAVVATGKATSVLRDDQRVQVDGDTGTVVVC